jgi:muramoyltetrapeptide carboxypeptidase
MNKDRVRWKTLQKFDAVEIVAPASTSTEMKLRQGLDWLIAKGLRPQFPSDMIRKDLFFAAPLEQQWEHFKQALYSDSKVIWCLRGGYGSMRLLPLLAKLPRPDKPKLMIGFSDITSLHIFFNQEWNWPTLHGRTIGQLSSDWEYNHEHKTLVDLLFGHINEVEFNQLLPMNKSAEQKKTIQSTVIGGNFRLIQSSIGTPWEIKPKGKILFIEDVSERGYSIDRMLEQLYQARIIDEGLGALLIGDFTNGQEKNGEDLTTAALERFAKRVDYPVLRGLPCGHATENNYPLPFNTNATLVLGALPKLICKTNN